MRICPIQGKWFNNVDVPLTAIDQRGRFIRRRILQGLALGALPSPLLTRAADSKTLNFVSYGGSYGAAVQTHFVTPFEEQTGIKVNFGVNSSLSPIKIQVLSKNVQWDLAEVNGGEFVAGLKDDLFEPLDTSVVDVSNVPEFARHKFGVEYALFLSGMGYDQRKVSDADAPKSWSQFWDMTRYPGYRALSKSIADTPTLEVALLASGVPIDKLYPLDVSMALQSLEKLGKKNIYWFEQNQEPVNFLEQQQGPLAQIASGRVAIANRKGGKIGFVYDQMQLNGDYLVVPKGARNKEAAFRMINFILTNDKAAVNWMTETTYAISNTRAVALMPPDVGARLPTSPALKGKYFVKDFRWWGANLDKTLVQFLQFIST
jgi:putative spermidine/putrescine transport system substrate-binding protein